MTRLKELRKSKGLSQQQVADHLGVVQNAYSRYENGERNIPIESINNLAKFYGVSIEYILGEGTGVSDVSTRFSEKLGSCAAKLKKLRLEKGITQNEMAYRFNITQNAVSRYENGDNEPSLALICQFADYFGVSVDYLLNREVEQVQEKNNDQKNMNIMNGLSPQEIQRVYDFIAGMRSSRQ